MSDRPKTPAERLREFELSDRQAAEIATESRPSHAGPHDGWAMAVTAEDDGLQLSGPHVLEGGRRPAVAGDLLMLFAARGKSIEAVRLTYQTVKADALARMEADR